MGVAHPEIKIAKANAVKDQIGFRLEFMDYEKIEEVDC